MHFGRHSSGLVFRVIVKENILSFVLRDLFDTGIALINGTALSLHHEVKLPSREFELRNASMEQILDPLYNKN